MSTINPLQSIRFINAIGSQSKGQPQSSIEPQAGQLLKALVVEVQADNRALLQIGENRISARTEVPLKVGQPLQLQVASTSPEVQLKIIGETLNHFWGKSITLIGKPIDITTLFRSLQQPQQPQQPQQLQQPVTSQSTTTSTPAAQGQAATVSISASTQAVVTQAAQNLTTVSLAQFTNHQIQATVVQSPSSNQFTLQAGEQRFTVSSPRPLQQGANLQLRLTESTPPQLQIISDNQPALAGTLLTVSNTPANTGILSGIFQQTGSIFEILSPLSRNTLETYFSHQQQPAQGGQAGAALKQLVDRLGLSFEKLLSQGKNQKAAATLKAALLEIINTLKGADQVSKSTSQLLTTLELFQLAQLQSETGHQFIFPLPLPFIEQGYMLVDQNAGDKENGETSGEQETRFSLHLKLSDIGNIRVDMFQTDEGLYIRFHTDSNEKAEFVKEYSDELRESITETALLGLSFGTEAEDPANALLRHVLPEGGGVLDTKV
ncbi:hypothetical protein [Desulfopila sp. IMCC35008]|uniref:hypothetical protein n=1 Tax=Desulfopila sp. IMCC35008 TaxID=2653858 RepID=UPI0013D04733|nr:hypothetical protein [Desulfopila sp. IMCC35008]